MSLFFHRSLPIEADVRRLVTGSEVFGGTAGTAITVAVDAVIILSVLLCLVRHDRASAFAVALLAFPLIFAAQPGTWFWQDGRYVVFLSPLIALALAGAADAVSPPWWRPAQLVRRRLPLVLLAAVVVAVGVLTSFAFARDNGVAVSSYDRNWRDPNGPVDQAISVLERHGVREGYAEYWVAYKVDLLSRGALTITPARGDVVRSGALMAEVDRSSRRAWLFVPPSRLSEGYRQFSPTSFIVGPRAVTEAQFIAVLTKWSIGYRTVSAGILAAVIPDRPITYADFKAVGG